MAVLQNSVEQALAAIGVHLVLATLLNGRELLLIPGLVGLFCLGRIAFRIGYPGGAGSRAFGMSLSSYPTLAASLLALGLMIGRG